MIFLNGYTTQATAYEVKDYPYGFRLRTSIFYWIESKKGNGDRVCTYTIDPRNGRKNKPKCGTYSTFCYLYLNEENHVKHGVIDSYDLKEFLLRFDFLLNKIGVQYLSQVQQDNIRKNHYDHLRGSIPYWLPKYSPDTQQDFKNWCTATLKHILTCDFKDLVTYPERPEPDQPDKEIKFTVTERYII